MDGAVLAAANGRRDAAAARMLVMAHFVFHGRVGGAEHMLYNVLRGLDHAGVDLGVVCADAANLDPAFVAEFERLQPRSLVASGGGGSRFVSEQRACLHGALTGDAVLFPNYFVPPAVPRRLGRVASVLHDMQFRHFPAYFSGKKRAWLAASQGFAMRRSDVVIAISEFVRQDILRYYGQRFDRKVVTIPNPVSWDRFVPRAASGADERPLAQPYVLSVAAAYAHKNLEVLLRAFALVAARDKDLSLVFCGQAHGGLRGVAGDRPGLDAMVEALGLQGRVQVTGYVDDVALGRWYRHATMFAFPSVFEGFGMPPVEALGFGLPTLTTGLTALSETTLGLSVEVNDAYRIEEWADHMLEITGNPARHRPSAEAVTRLRSHYNPERIGQLYAAACLGR